MNLADWLDRVPAPWVSRHGFTVRWFDTWHPVLDEALRELPEMESCPHELFRQLCQNPSPVRKKVALISRHGDPVAVAGLRRKRWDWEPVGAGWGCPLEVMPARPEFVLPALAALRTDVQIWGWAGSPPPRWARDRICMPVRKINPESDFEGYWRQTGLSNARKTRRRTTEFDFVVDRPGVLEWAIRGWVERYRYEPNRPADALDDLLLRARYLKERGRLHAFALFDDGEPIAASIGVVRGRELCGTCAHRLANYERFGVGRRLMKLVCFWAAERGFMRHDIGLESDSQSYKALWGPVDGDRWAFRISPPHLEYARRTWRSGRASLGTLAQLTRRALGERQFGAR